MRKEIKKVPIKKLTLYNSPDVFNTIADLPEDFQTHYLDEETFAEIEEFIRVRNLEDKPKAKGTLLRLLTRKRRK